MAGMNSDVRTLEEVRSVINYAKLDESDLKSVTQVLSFDSKNEEDGNFKFMELDNSLLNYLQEGQSLIFRGSKDENAVLCTKDRTFEVKEAETSNSMLLIPDLIFPNEMEDNNENQRSLEKRKVCGVFHKYYELRQCNPRLSKLRKLLEESQYRGKEHEEDIETSGVTMYTFQDLLEQIQASEVELWAALGEILACQINGVWRLLEHEYHFRVLSYILNMVESHSWSLDAVPKAEVLEFLSDLVPAEILGQCFDWYTEPGAGCSDGDLLYQLLEDKVCRFMGEVLLRPAVKFNLEEFEMAWQQSVPEGMQTSPKHLEGIALMDRTCKPEVVWYFPESDLSEDIMERFRFLFRTKEKWNMDEIHPYIKRLATGKMNVNALLTKYARASTVGGVKYYCAKHAK